jgi:2-isopropylmalate synthase
MEAQGFTFEAADASFELLLLEESSGKRPSFFSIAHWLTTTEHSADGTIVTKSEVTVTAKGREITCSGSGNGPVNSFDTALRNGLNTLYPQLEVLELTDYKVRILEGRLGTGAITRVLIETSDGKGEWNTVGVHENVIAASAMALEDALTFGLLRQGLKP